MLQTLSLLVVFITLCSSQKSSFENYRVFRLYPKTEQHVSLLREIEDLSNGMSFWNGPSFINRTADLMVSPGSLAEFMNLMNSSGLQYELYVKNVQRLIDTENLKLRVRNNEEFALNEYHTLDEVYDYLENLAKNYDQVTILNPGKTSEGRVIKGVKISFKEGNPGIFIEAGIHAREWISTATALYLIDQLLNSDDQEIRALAEEHDWYIFPNFNPDGYVYSHDKNRMWRKTRSNNNVFCIGTDANRNWGFKWMNGGASKNPCSEIFAGSSAFSEPETKSMSQYILSLKNKIFAYISFHSYSQLLLFPYGHTSAHLDNYDEELSMGKKAIAALAKKHSTQYVTGNIAETIYIASGSSSDWVKATLKLPIVFTYEFRDKGRYGFILPADLIIPNGEEIIDSLIAMFKEAAHFGYPK